MARVRVRLDSAGIAAVMQGPGMTAATRAATERIAATARAQMRQTTSEAQQSTGDELPIDAATRPVTRSRRIRDARHLGLITITHPAGLGMEAKHGVLSRAAAAAGFRVRDDYADK